MAYSHYEVAHRFANDIGTRCKGGNMFFEDDCIYSYGHHFCIAQKYKGKMLFTEEGYSNSTAKHKSIVRSACSQWDFIYCAVLSYDGLMSCGALEPGTKTFYEKNFRVWGDDIKYIVEHQLGRARKPEKYLSEILGIVGRVERFCEFFGIDVPEEFTKWDDIRDRQDILDFAKSEAQKADKARREREAKAEQEFMQFKCNSFGGKYQIVRYNQSDNRFETSMQVKIPYEIGKAFYEKLRDDTLQVGDKCLYYTVRSIGSDIKVGCHTFRKKWLLDFGKKIFEAA